MVTVRATASPWKAAEEREKKVKQDRAKEYPMSAMSDDSQVGEIWFNLLEAAYPSHLVLKVEHQRRFITDTPVCCAV